MGYTAVVVKAVSLVALFEGDNGLGFSKAPWSTALNALFLLLK